LQHRYQTDLWKVEEAAIRCR